MITTTYKTSLRLQKLGINLETIKFYGNKKDKGKLQENEEYDFCPAPIFNEIWSLLPEIISYKNELYEIKVEKARGRSSIGYYSKKEILYVFSNLNISEAAGKLLVWCKEYNLLVEPLYYDITIKHRISKEIIWVGKAKDIDDLLDILAKQYRASINRWRDDIELGVLLNGYNNNFGDLSLEVKRSLQEIPEFKGY